MRIMSIICFIFGFAFLIAGIKVASEPSVSPTATVFGAFAVPGLLIWWASIFWKKANQASSKKDE